MFEISQSTLRAAFADAARYASPRSTLPVLANVLVKAEPDGEGGGPGKLSLISNNLEGAALAQISVENVTPGEICVPAKTTLDLLAQWEDQVSAKLSERATVLHLNGGKSRAEIKGLPATDFPPTTFMLTGAPAPVQITLDGAAFKDAIRRVLPAASDDDGRPILTGVYIEIDPVQVSFTTADGFRAVHVVIPLENGALQGAESVNVVAPANIIADAAKLCGKTAIIGIGKLTGDRGGNIHFSFPDLGKEILCQTIAGAYPQYQEINYKSAPEFRFSANLAALRAMLKRAAVFAKQSSHIVRLKFEKSGDNTATLNASSVSDETGAFNETLEVTALSLGAPVIEQGINYQFLLECLDAVPDATVIYATASDTSPIQLTSQAPGWWSLVMPMHLS